MPPDQMRTGHRRQGPASGHDRVLRHAGRLVRGLRPHPLSTLPFRHSGGHRAHPAVAPAGAAAAVAPAEAMPAGRRWPFQSGWVDGAWVVFAAVNLAAIVILSHWAVVPFYLIWISFAILYGFRVWALQPTLWILGAVIAATGAAIGWHVWHDGESVAELYKVPLIAVLFWVMVWHARRRLVAAADNEQISAENARLLAIQRRFLQDASHQLRTPITIALGHAELLASGLAGSGTPEERDIGVVVGELARLRRLSERLLMIAAAEDPEFLRPEPVALDRFTMDVLRKWMPTAQRSWQLGRLDPVMVEADKERLGLAVDALLENAIRHTSDGDMIQLSVLSANDGSSARMIIADAGTGIPPSERDHIFERFRSGAEPGDGRRTGLGLALVRAVARAHGGEALVRSTPGHGSEFELMLPVTAPVAEIRPAGGIVPGIGIAAPAGLTAALPRGPGEPGGGAHRGGTVPASAPSPSRPAGQEQTALEGKWRSRTR